MKKYVDNTKLNEFATKLHAKQKTIFALKSELGSPLVASTAAGMTDQTKVYVYVGEETGYTAGDWYYYDGSAWASGGVYNSTAFETDDTLAVPGMAADAKAAGDLVAELDDKSPIHRGQVPNTDDINNYISPGQWYSSNNTPTHWPFPNKGGRLVVFGSTGSNYYSKVQVVYCTDGRVAVRVGTDTAVWSSFTIFSDNSATLTDLGTKVTALLKTEAYTPTYTWEQGAFTTSSWTKSPSTAANHTKYIRFADYPDLSGIAAIRITVPDGYKVYIGCYGWSSAKSTEKSTTIWLKETDRTKLNLSLYHDNAVIEPSEGADVGLEFIPFVQDIKNRIEGITNEAEGLIIQDESTTVKVGIYGASIIAGYGVSDYSTYHNGTTIDLTTIGYSKTETRYTGNKTWAQKLKAYLETNFSNVSVTNWGISGASAETYYNYLKKSQENSNSPIDTDVDVAIVMMGNNGRNKSMANNISNFANIINVFLDAGAQVFFLTPTAAFNTGSSFIINTYQIMHCAKAAARNAGICAVDAFSFIEEYCSENGVSLAYDANAEKNFLNSDNLHPSDLGHEIIYKAVKNLLKV